MIGSRTKPTRVVLGARVALLRPERQHLPAILEWASDPRITRTLITQTPWPLNPDILESWLLHDDPLTAFLIEDLSQPGLVLGFVHFHSYDAFTKSIKFAIAIHPDHHGRGLGGAATRLLVDYGFEQFDLERIALSAFAANISGVRAYERAGFVQEGVRRKAWFRDGKFHDEVVMSLLVGDWRKQQRR